jgi:hypothetical protein
MDQQLLKPGCRYFPAWATVLAGLIAAQGCIVAQDPEGQLPCAESVSGSSAQETVSSYAQTPHPVAAPRDGREFRVLFVGNSLTSGNDLPGLVQAMAAAGGVKLRADTVAVGNFSLEDHWQQGRAREALASATWDYVVLQQGPSSRPESQVHLREWAARWADETRRNGATPALYMVWPFQGQKNGFEQVSQSYRSARRESCRPVKPGRRR